METFDKVINFVVRYTHRAMIYFITVIILLLSLYIYFPIARKYSLLAGVNNRSSHKKPVITAAGFIFYLSYVIYMIDCIVFGKEIMWFWFIGLTLLAVVSFIDDLKDVWFLIRLVAQTVAASFLLLQIGHDTGIVMTASVSQWSAAIMMLIVAVGLFNLYNFMDGLNGMLGGLALSMSVPLLLIDIYVFDARNFVDPEIIGLTIVATLVFLFFNFRAQPKCFSGDVGSIVLGYMMTYFVFSLVVKTGNVAYFLLFSAVLIEAGLTVMQRLFAGDNIFAPHRIHLFQLFCNEFYKSHRLVSGIYAGIQFGFGMVLFVMNIYEMPIWLQNCILWPVFAALCVTYLLIKRKKMGGHLLSYRGENSTTVKTVLTGKRKKRS